MSKTIIIGIDGLEPSITYKLIEANVLPNIKKIVDKGISGQTKSTILPMSPVAWSTILTGVPPEHHGIFDFLKIKNNLDDFPLVFGNERKYPEIYKILSAYNKKSIIMNIPYTYPIGNFNGCGIAGSFVPKHAVDYIYQPPELQDEIKNNIGKYKVRPDIYLPTAFTKLYFKNIFDNLKQKEKAGLYLIKNKQWDLFFSVFFENDRITHEYGHKIFNIRSDSIHYRYYCEYLKKIDTIIGKYMEYLSPEDNIIILSDHGMNITNYNIDLNLFLLNHGYITLKNRGITKLKKILFDLGFSPVNIHKLLDKTQVSSILEHILREDKMGIGLNHKLFLSFDDIDWEKTKAISISRQVGKIYLTLGNKKINNNYSAEYAKTINELTHLFSDMVTPDTNKKLIKKIYSKKQFFNGSNNEQAPDLTLIPDDWNYYFYGLFGFGKSKLFFKGYRKRGQHRPFGFIAATGKIFKNDNIKYIIDLDSIAPLILTSLNVEILPYMNNTFQYIKDNVPIKISKKQIPPISNKNTKINVQDTSIKKQLKNLGYI